MSSSQSPLPTQQTQNTNIYAFNGIRTRIPAVKWPQTWALDRTAIGIGLTLNHSRLKLMSILIRNWVRTSQKTRCITIIWKYSVPTLRELIAIHWGHIKKYVNTILLLLLFTTIEFSLGGSLYTSNK